MFGKWAMQLDHLVVAGESLAEAVAHIEDALGVKMRPGGEHLRYGTHNALLGLGDGVYLEAIAVNPQATPQEQPRWFGLDSFEGPPRLISWAVRVPDLDIALQAYPIAGGCVAMQRGTLRWRMAVTDDGTLPMGGAFPSLLEWQTAPIPGDALPACGLRLDGLQIAAPDVPTIWSDVQTTAAIDVVQAAEVSLEARFTSATGERILR